MNDIFLKITISIFFYILSPSVHSCGDYTTLAKVSMREGSPALIVYPGSLSEIYLKASLRDSFKLTPYLNRYVKADLIIEKRNDKTHFKIDKIGQIKPIIPKLLSTNLGTSLDLIKKADCK